MTLQLLAFFSPIAALAWNKLGLPLPRWLWWAILIGSAGVLAISTVTTAWPTISGLFGPAPLKDGSAADEPITVTTWAVTERKDDIPFHIDLIWQVSGAEEISDCNASGMFWSIDPDAPAYIDESANTLLSELDISDALGQCHAPIKRGQPAVAHVYPHNGYTKDETVADIKGGKKYLYVLRVWKYRQPGSTQSYTQIVCRVFRGSFDESESCGDRWNRATVHTGIVGVIG